MLYGIRKTGLLASFFVGVAVLLLAGCGGGQEEDAVYFSGQTMGTSYHVTVVAPPENASGEELGEEIQAVLDNVDDKMSTYKEDSELSRLNRAAVGTAVSISPELMYVLTVSRQIYTKTEGAFDPSVGPLVDLWGFGPTYKEDDIPDPEAIQALVEKEGFDSLELSPERLSVVKRKRVSLDLSAVAKGYGADKVAELLRQKGISRYMVEVGGEMSVSGVNARGALWQIAVEKPAAESREVQRVIAVTDQGIATSGDYRNYFERDGKRYSHTIDPRTGYPIDHRLASVTVIAETSARADALATAFMVMGTEAVLNYADKENVAVFTLSKTDDGYVESWSAAFNQYLAGAGSAEQNKTGVH